MNSQLLNYLGLAAGIITEIAGIAQRAMSENRDPTPEEQASVEARIKDLNNTWASLAPKPEAPQA